MTRRYPDLGSASDWLKQISQAARPIRNTTQIWLVTRHQYEISVLVSKTTFCGETDGGVAKYRLFSQAITLPNIPGKGWCSSSFSRCTLSLGSAWSIRRFWSVHWKDTFTLKLQCNIYMNTSFSLPKKVDCKFIDMCNSKLSCQTLTSS